MSMTIVRLLQAAPRCYGLPPGRRAKGASTGHKMATPSGWKAAWRSHRRDRRAGNTHGTGQMRDRDRAPTIRDGARPDAVRRPDYHHQAGRVQLQPHDRAGDASRSRCRVRTGGNRGHALVAALAAQARLVRAHADEDKGIAAPRPAPAGRGAADIQGISRNGGTAKSPAAKWARIAS